MCKHFCQSLCHSATSLLVSATPTSLAFLFASPLRLALLLLFFPLLYLFSDLTFSGTSGRKNPPFLSGHTGSFGDSFLPGHDTADELAGQGALL